MTLIHFGAGIFSDEIINVVFVDDHCDIGALYK
jgi:hypothetical protein